MLKLRLNYESKVFAYTLLFRIIVILAGILFSSIVYQKTSTDIWSTWAQWDAKWYLDIAQNGYDNTFPDYPPEHELCNQGIGYCQRNFAFFPLYPVLIKSFSIMGISYTLSGIIVSTLAISVASLGLYKLMQIFSDKKTAIFSVILLNIFPTSYLFSGIMTESLFICFLIWTYYFALKQKWSAVILLSFLLTLTRINGIFIMVSLVLIKLEQEKFKLGKLFDRSNYKLWLGLLAGCMGLLLFMLFLRFQTGDALAFVKILKYWERPVVEGNPLIMFFRAFVDYSTEGLLIHLYNLAFLGMVVGLFILNWFKKYLPLSLSTILLWSFFSLLSGITLSLARYISVLFPLYMLIAIFAKTLGRLRWLVLVISALAFAFLTMLYLNQHWVTI